MKVKDVIASALNLLGRADLVSALSSVSNADKEGQERISTLLYCFNAVEDELAHHYVPLTVREEISSDDTRFYYNAFGRNPVKIKRVTVDGEKAKFEIFATYMTVNAQKITVEYEYAPARKELDGDCDYGDEVGEYLIALGMAAEYCYVNGEAELAAQWENKYRERLDKLQRTLPACEKIPPRRWV